MKELILFTGPEASGKTTIAYLIKKYLENQGIKAKVVRLRGTHTLAYILMLFMRDVLGLYGSELHYYRLKLPKRLKWLWLYIELLAVIPLIILYYYIMRLKYVVIGERSVVDVVVWLLTGIEDEPHKLLLRKPIKFLILLATRYRPRTVYVTADLNSLISRKPYEKSLIIKMLPYYNALAKHLELLKVNTSTCRTYKCAKEALKVLER